MMYNETKIPETDDQDIGELLESLSLDIMKDNITNQINGQLESTRDFLSIVISKFEEMQETIPDGDVLRNVKYEIHEFCYDLAVQIASHYGLAFNFPNEDGMEIIEILESMYYFFICNRENNVQEFFIRYIEANKESIIETLGLIDKTGDITTNANRKKNIDRQNIPILSNIDDIVEFVGYNAGVSLFDFLNIIDDGEYYMNNVIDYFNNNFLIGEFVTQYISEVINDDDGQNSTIIRNNIRISFTK